MQVRILGPVEGWGPDGPVPLESTRERAVLARLALGVGRAVTPEALIDGVWGEDPPTSAPKSLQSHLSRLRGRLAEGLIGTEGSNYRLLVEPDEVDAVRFERLIVAGRVAHEEGDHRRAVRLLRQAADLWRGPPLTDLADGPVRDGETARLGELRWSATETRIDAELALGRHERVVAEIEQLIGEQPLRERPWGQLMLALHRSARSADALMTYRRLRALLGEELGLEPSADLRHLEAQILQQDPALDAPEPSPPRRLPAPLTRFVGRERQLAAVDKLLGAHRLVTLLGPGGVGKSRLALEAATRAAEDWPDGVWWVDLARITDPALVLPRIARVLDLTVPPGMDADDALHRFVASRRLLLVVDNAEQMASDIGDDVRALLESGPDLRVLVTSRTPLGVEGEQRYPVPPFEVPGPHDDAELSVESMRFLGDRLAERGVQEPDDETRPQLAELCRLADGLPLALELIAGRIGVRSPSEVVVDLQDRVTLLTAERRAADARHASLQAVLDATVTMLDPVEREMLGELSVLAGPFSTAAALDVAGFGGTGALESLLDAGLVLEAEPGPAGGERRYRLLDTTRAYAAGLVEPGALRSATRRHARHYRDAAVELGSAMDTPHEGLALEQIRQDDLDLRAALDWWLEHDCGRALAFARAIGRAWYVWGELTPLRQMLDRAIEGAERSGRAPEKDVGWAHLRRGWPRFLTGDVAGGEDDAARAIDLLTVGDDPVGAAFALLTRAHMTLLATADTDAAFDWYRQAIVEARRSGRPHAAAWALAEAAQALILADRVDGEVDAMLAEAEAGFVAASDDIGLAHVCMDRVLAAYARADLAEAARAAEEGLDHARLADERLVYAQIMTTSLGVGGLHDGDLDRAEHLLVDATRMAGDTQNLLQLGIALQAVAVLLGLRGEAEASARLWGASGTLAPYWPLFQRRYLELLAPVMDGLGDRFAVEAEVGAELDLDGVMALVRAQGGRLASL